MTTLYLHIGRGQTGTTAIQRFLSRHRQSLKERGLLYCAAGDTAHGGHQDFAKSFIDEPEAWMQPARDPEQARREVLREVSGSRAEAVLLSSENLTMANVAAVRRFFEPLPDRFTIKIIVFVRSQDELAESEYNQRVRSLRETRGFEEFVSGQLEGYDFAALAAPWAQHFGTRNVICRIYQGRATDCVQDFLSCIPCTETFVPDGNLVASGRRATNNSMGIGSLHFRRKLNGITVPFPKVLLRPYMRRLARDDLPALLMSSQRARAFRARFATSNQEFTKHFVGKSSAELGGRRYDDSTRDEVWQAIQRLELDS